jgi:hypothetical protein
MRWLPLLLLVGCASPGPASVALGTGWASFEPLADGQDLELVYGPQGGWHIDLSLRTTGLDADATAITYSAVHEGVSMGFPAELPLADALVLHTDTGWDRLGDRVVFDAQADTEILDRTMVVAVVVTSDGRVLEDQRTVTIVAPAEDGG